LAAINLDDDLTIQESAWRGRIITFGVLAAIVAAVGVALYFFYFKDGSTTLTRGSEDITVKRATINQTLIISGVADAQFNSNLIFQASGKVAAVNVKVGDVVKQGDVLASLESDDLSNAVASARANQQSAQLKLDDLLAGTEAADLAAADQGLAAAQAAATKAQNDYDDLADGASASDKAAAEQGVSAAAAQLASAKASRAKLDDAPSASDKAAAQAGVAQAQSALTAAQNASTSAQNSVTSSKGSLESAESTYCNLDPAPTFCTTRTAPISSADAAAMNTALSGSISGQPAAASGVITQNALYLNAVNAANSATAAVTSAQQALDAAQAKLNAANDGPSAVDKAAADAAVTSAEAAQTSATEKLNLLNQGATEFQLSTAKSAMDSAFAALTAAQAKRDQAYRGPKGNAIEQARAAVRTAALQVEAAQIRLKNAQIVAPFDGTVGAVGAKVGEFFGTANATPPIVLLTPEKLRLKMDVGETDYANLKAGQAGGVLFDSIPGKVFPFVISEIGLTPSVTQGVVTYQVKATLVLPADGPRPAPGMNARGQIITSSKPNVLVVPPRAIRRSGNDQVVDLRRNGGVEEQIITTGASDNEQIEVLTGLNENDVVVVASLTTAKPTPKAVATLPGNVR
jgi:multidrug efflux pump subunit AcrA (membrane-fusion protein)